jgi:hypothetical protein
MWPSPQPSTWHSHRNITRGSNLGLKPSHQVSAAEAQTLSFAGEAETKCLGSISPPNDAGITVAGSHVNQKFGTTYTSRLNPTKHVIVFELKGTKSDGQAIVQPVLTRTKVECPTCGRHAKSSARFCSNCSTCLV